MTYYELNKSQKFLGKLFSLVKSFPKPLQKHACKRRKTLRALLSNSRKLFEKSLTKNFTFCTQYRFSFLTTGASLPFIYNNYSTLTYGSETKFRTKVLCLLSFKKVSEKKLDKKLYLLHTEQNEFLTAGAPLSFYYSFKKTLTYQKNGLL